MGNRKLEDIFKLLISIVACQCAGLIGSLATVTAIPTWYATLDKPPFTPAQLVVCSGLDHAVSADGHISIYRLAQGTGQSANPGSTNGLSSTIDSERPVVSGLLWPPIPSLWSCRYYSPVDCDTIYHTQFLQDIDGGGNNSTALYSVGEFCHGVEYINMDIKSIVPTVSYRQN